MTASTTGKAVSKPADLRASAGIAKTLGQEFGAPVQNAVNTGATVAGQLTGWSVAGGRAHVGTGWSKALVDLQQRLASTAAAATRHP
ncbi:hypothetical protein AB0F71_18290 [Kitasatospora sp. NPDC028055]|uniref:hypothetical protein n=1 Tax=Kitasatospora sp. NPDC028055 TaxID=3155653 RepID=UPI0033DFBC8E